MSTTNQMHDAVTTALHAVRAPVALKVEAGRWYFDGRFKRLMFVEEIAFGGILAGAAVDGVWRDTFVIADAITSREWVALDGVESAKRLVSARDYRAAVAM